MSEWHPIETAPTNGTPVLLYLDPPLDTTNVLGYVCVEELRIVVGWGQSAHRRVIEWECGFCDEGAADTDGNSSTFLIQVHPTHWMHLPAIPARGGGSVAARDAVASLRDRQRCRRAALKQDVS